MGSACWECLIGAPLVGLVEYWVRTGRSPLREGAMAKPDNLVPPPSGGLTADSNSEENG